MIELAIFLAHCFATFGLACVAMARGGNGVMRDVPESAFRAAATSYMQGMRAVIVPLAVLELVSGGALLGFERWRDSSFAPTMLIVVAIWIWAGAVKRPLTRKAGDSLADFEKWQRAGRFEMIAWILRSVALAVVALV